MNPPSANIRSWAERLLAVEAAANPSAPESQMRVAGQVSGKLQMSLTRFVGADGFSALQRRALALARTDVPSLKTVTVRDGRLEGMEESDKEGEAATAITAHLLALLVTFVGEPLTLSLMRDAFPDTYSRVIVEPEES